ncbi:MAG: hypothetical protein JNL10_01995 [Verrucomicrobiales bacterium]|nr:hypothetical protein [Verrucomicrobiales bacterium]
MKSAVLAGFLLLPVALAQQVNTPTVTRPTVAVAPSSAGVNGGGAATGGISFVTRRTSMATPVLAGAAFFGAAGVPVVQGAAVAVPAAAPVASSPTAGNPGAVNALAALAAGGNVQAREALRALRAAESRTPAASGR